MLPASVFTVMIPDSNIVKQNLFEACKKKSMFTILKKNCFCIVNLVQIFVEFLHRKHLVNICRKSFNHISTVGAF